MISTVQEEIVGRFGVPSWFRKVTRETANDVYQCGQTEVVRLGGVSRLRSKCVGLDLRSRCSNRNKVCRTVCVERSVCVQATATREIGARVHGRSDTERPLSVTRARARNGKAWLRSTITHNVKVCVWGMVWRKS